MTDDEWTAAQETITLSVDGQCFDVTGHDGGTCPVVLLYRTPNAWKPTLMALISSA